MFDFFSMAGNYEERVVQNDVVNGATIDTAAVTDSDQPYETGIQHPQYNGGSWVIVEMYDDKKSALAGHKRWVETFTKGLPSELEDKATASIAKLLDTVSGDNGWRKRVKAE